MVVHPEVGKWLIALGVKAFGMDPFGWRIAAAVVGSLMVLVMCRFVRRVTGSTAARPGRRPAAVLDGLHLVLSRLALLDIFLAFFILCGVHCVVADRQWFRDAAGAAGATRAARSGRGCCAAWRLAAVSFGLAVGTKWTALFPLAAFGLLAFAWSGGARRAFGHRRALLRAVLLDGVPAFLHLVLVALVVYVATWTGWLMHAEEYEKALSNTQYTTYDGGEQWPTATEPDAEGPARSPSRCARCGTTTRTSTRSTPTSSTTATHVYASKPAGWLVMSRPVGVDAQLDIQPGSQGCDAPAGSTCLRQVLLLGNPLMWWGGALALLLRGAGAGSARATGASASPWSAPRRRGCPWLLYDDRPIFVFYAIACLPFVVLAISWRSARWSGAPTHPARGGPSGSWSPGSYVVLVLLAFAWFWPIWTDQLITHSEWLDRIWFTRWI